jgi:hypothetical protein
VSLALVWVGTAEGQAVAWAVELGQIGASSEVFAAGQGR